MSDPQRQWLRCAFLFRWPYNPYLDLLAEELRAQGVDVQIPDRCLWFASRIRRGGHVHIVHLQEIAPFFLATTLPKTIVKSCLSLIQLAYLKLCGTKIVWTAHDLRTHWERYPRIERAFTTAIAALADAIVTHCEGATRAVAARFRVRNANKIVSMPHGHFMDAYPNIMDRDTARRHFGLAPGVLVLLCFGLVRAYKGFEDLLDGFFALSRSETHLIIAGKPFDESTARAVRERIAGHDNVTFVPEFISNGDVQLFMNACDAAVFAYREILTSGAIILAMSFGKACVAPCKGCIPEVLDADGAFLYDGDSGLDLKSVLQRVSTQQVRLPAMGVHNRLKVARWPWKLVAAATLEVYRSILPERAVIFGAANGTVKREERERQQHD